MKNITKNKIWMSYDILVKERATRNGLEVEYTFGKGWLITTPVPFAGVCFAFLRYGQLVFTEHVKVSIIK